MTKNTAYGWWHELTSIANIIPLNSLIFNLIFEWISSFSMFENINASIFMHKDQKNQNSWGIVSMQKLIIALVVISRLNMFQMCPILESLGLFSFHGGSQKSFLQKISKNA